MCTVTYFPLNEHRFVLTSNRDVPFQREEAMPPKKYMEDGVELFYPKDGKAGGSWIGSSSKNRLLCILNGGFVNHKAKRVYKKSRGKILIELLKCDEIVVELNQIDLNHIEPFTMIIVDWNRHLKLSEFVWDGESKHRRDLKQEPHIWSSSTLYSDRVKGLRVQWFNDWQSANKTEIKNILDFHLNAGIGDPKIDVMMRRQKVGTVSVTLVAKNENSIDMSYKKIPVLRQN